jgi:two-component system, NtrC family, response regulator AtoC
MVLANRDSSKPMQLVVTGEAESWLPALGQIVGKRLLHPRKVRSDHELLEVVCAGQADAAVLDDDSPWDIDVLRLLRLIRQANASLPVVVVTEHTDRAWLENALRLAATSVVVKPLELEQLLRQIYAIMSSMETLLRRKEL